MKNLILPIIIFLALTTFFSNKANSQCRQQMVYSCATCRGIYLQDFNTKLSEKDSETMWTVVLNKNTRYKFNLCTPNGNDDVILTLYDSQSNVCGSTYNKTNNKDYEYFDFVCKESGNYYVSIKFKEGYKIKKTCAVGMLYFVSSADD